MHGQYNLKDPKQLFVLMRKYKYTRNLVNYWRDSDERPSILGTFITPKSTFKSWFHKAFANEAKIKINYKALPYGPGQQPACKDRYNLNWMIGESYLYVGWCIPHAGKQESEMGETREIFILFGHILVLPPYCCMRSGILKEILSLFLFLKESSPILTLTFNLFRSIW